MAVFVQDNIRRVARAIERSSTFSINDVDNSSGDFFQIRLIIRASNGNRFDDLYCCQQFFGTDAEVILDRDYLTLFVANRYLKRLIDVIPYLKGEVRRKAKLLYEASLANAKGSEYTVRKLGIRLEVLNRYSRRTLEEARVKQAFEKQRERWKKQTIARRKERARQKEREVKSLGEAVSNYLFGGD